MKWQIWNHVVIKKSVKHIKIIYFYLLVLLILITEMKMYWIKGYLLNKKGKYLYYFFTGSSALKFIGSILCHPQIRLSVVENYSQYHKELQENKDLILHVAIFSFSSAHLSGILSKAILQYLGLFAEIKLILINAYIVSMQEQLQ